MINIIQPVFAAPGPKELTNQYQFGGLDSLGEGLSYFVPGVFALGAIAVTFYFILAVFKLITSGGDKETVASARNMITHAIIGFILLMMLFLILRFLPEFFGLDIDIIGP